VKKVELFKVYVMKQFEFLDVQTLCK